MELRNVEESAASFVLVSSGLALLFRVLVVDMVHTYKYVRKVISEAKK